MTLNNFDQQRQKDLEDNLVQEQELLKQFEDAFRYERDPRIKARYQKDIERQKEVINQYQKEYQELKKKLSGNSPNLINDVSKRTLFDNSNNPRQSIFSNVNVGGSINIQGNITQQNNSEAIFNKSPQTQKSNQSPSTIKIFLASSSELKEDREQFEIFINRKNKQYIKEYGVFLELVQWEDFLDAMSQTRLQDEYNRAITDCDIFVSLFYTKVGKYTEEEFWKALETFKKNNKLLIYTYFKTGSFQIDEIEENNIMSLLNFKKKLKKLGHFPTKYNDISELKYHFGEQLTKFLPELIG